LYIQTVFSEISCKSIHILYGTIVIKGGTEEAKGWLEEEDFV
jgi:hypothetical protein